MLGIHKILTYIYSQTQLQVYIYYLLLSANFFLFFSIEVLVPSLCLTQTGTNVVLAHRFAVMTVWSREYFLTITECNASTCLNLSSNP